MRILIPILALLLLVGCVQEIDQDELRSALRDLHQEHLNDPLPTWPDSLSETDSIFIPSKPERE